MKTVAGICSGYSDNLLLRAADVTLKERRRLVLVARECPLSTIHLRNMLELSQMGVEIMPPMLTYYNHPKTLDDCTRHIVGKILDRFGIEGQCFNRWEGMDE
jgi:4-hydroxy-3-polyprenylbenzoate decarboxylase